MRTLIVAVPNSLTSTVLNILRSTRHLEISVTMSNVVYTAFAVASWTSRNFSNHVWIRKGPRLSTVITKKSNNHTFLISPKKPTIHSTPLIVSPILHKFSFLTKITQNNHFSSRQNMSSNINTFESEPDLNYSESDIAQKFLFFNVLKDGRIHVLSPPSHKVKVPPSFGSTAGAVIKDVQISSDVSVRIFLPSSYASTNACITHKLPVVLYIHGGGFCMQSAFSEDYTRFGSQIAAEANAMVVSVDYGLFPTRPIPACYEDSWAALQWVASHSKGSGPEPWINDHADLRRIFVGGDSAGGNISHTLLAKVGSIGLPGDAKVEGMILIHPYFGEDDKMWMFMCPTNLGPRDPRMKPAVEDLARIGCERVLVLLAEKDGLYGVGKMYADELIKSGWKGKVEIMENKDKEHCFHYSDHMDLEAVAIRRRIASFIHNQS